MRFLLILAFIMTGCTGTQSPTELCTETLPLRVFESEPVYMGEISLDSDDAAIRYIAIAKSLTGESEYISHYLDIYEHGIDQFVAYNNSTYAVESKLFAQQLAAAQGLIQELAIASQMNIFRGYVPRAFFGQRCDDDLVMETHHALTAVRDTLEADAVRLWVRGDTTDAIHRVELMLRIAQQLLLEPNADILDGSHSADTMDMGLKLFERMLESNQCGDRERALIRDSVRTLQSNDPAGLLWLFARTSASNNAAMQDWFSVKGGSHELWVVIGHYLGAMAMIEPILDAFDNAFAVTFDDKPVEAGTDPFKWPPDGTDIETVSTKALTELIDIDFEELEVAFDRATPDSVLMIQELCKDHPDLVVLKTIGERAELDETPISALLLLDFAHTNARRNHELLELRDRVFELCTTE